jgi:hypothetical protein
MMAASKSAVLETQLVDEIAITVKGYTNFLELPVVGPHNSVTNWRATDIDMAIGKSLLFY